MSVTAVDTRWTTIAGPTIRVARGPEPNALAAVLRELIALNVRHRPLAALVFRRLDVAATIRVTDMEVPITLDFCRGHLAVHAGPGPRPANVEIVTDGHALLAFAEAPKLAGIPDLRTREGRLVIRRVLSGRLRLVGLRRRPLALLAVALLCDAHRADSGEWPPRKSR